MKIFSFNDPAGRVLTMVLCLMLLSPLNTHGATDPPTPSAETAAPEAKKIHITADRLISNTPDNHAEFIGNVRARQGETLITADSLEIFFFRGIQNRTIFPGPIPGEAGGHGKCGN